MVDGKSKNEESMADSRWSMAKGKESMVDGRWQKQE